MRFVTWAIAIGGLLAATSAVAAAAPMPSATDQPVRLRFVLRTQGPDAATALTAQDAALRQMTAALRAAGVTGRPQRVRLAVTRWGTALPVPPPSPGGVAGAPAGAAPATVPVVALGRFVATLPGDRQVLPALQAALAAGAVWVDVAPQRLAGFHHRDGASWAVCRAPLLPAGA
jgi:hypothetical protein